MMRIIQRRTDQIVHGGIDDDKVLRLAVLHEQYARHKKTRVADQQPAGLEDQPAAEVARRLFDNLGIGLRMRRRLVVVAVRNSQTAAEVDVRYGMAIGPQRAHKVRKQRKSVAERIEL